MLFMDNSRTLPLVTFAPPPSPSPSEGWEGRVGVVFLEVFMQHLGK